jgi:hypothetical protein
LFSVGILIIINIRYENAQFNFIFVRQLNNISKLTKLTSMKNLKIIFALFAAIAWVACGNQTDQAHDHDHDHDHEGEVVSTTDGIHYGEVISDEGAISYDELVTSMEDKESIEDVTVIATVGDVCQKKGCWMKVSNGESEEGKLFVQFEDYGFFMPFDLAGSVVAIHGKAYYDITSVEDLRHYAEDKGATQEEIDAITEPKKEFKFMASGVKILERSEPASEGTDM